jgi:hypothetical protein
MQGHRSHPARFGGMRHDDHSARAFYILADASYVQVWTFKPASFEEAARMWALIDENGSIDRAVAMRVYQQATGRLVTYLQ